MDMNTPPVVTLTEAALDRVRALIDQSEEPVLGLRIGVKTRGCSGMSYFVEYAKEQQKFEDVVEQDGVKVFIDPAATMFLIGSEVDYEEGDLESGFVFRNPNEASRCGCGESFNIN